MPKVTVSDNGAGKVRVTFSAYQIWSTIYTATAVDSSWYIYNVTRAAVSAITAKGGTEAGGYYFDTSENFAGTAWATNDRCCPQGANTTNNYTSCAALYTAVSNGDQVYVGFYNTNDITDWPDRFGTMTKVFSCDGLLTGARLTFYASTILGGCVFSGDLSGQATQVLWRNICIRDFSGAAGSANGFFYYDSSGTGGGVRISQCRIDGLAAGITFWGGASNVCQADNNFITCSNSGVQLNVASLLYENTCLFNGYGIDNNSKAATIKNNLCAYNYIDFGRLTNATVTYCCSRDATADDVGGAGNIVSQTPTQLAMDGDLANGKMYAYGGRISAASTCYHTGNNIVGLTIDLDGNTRDGATPSIGCHEGFTVGSYASGITAADLGTNKDAQVNWDAFTPVVRGVYVTGYKVRYGVGGAANTVFATALSTATSLKVTGLTNGTEYTFNVEVVCNCPIGELESTGSATTTATPTTGTAASIPTDASVVPWGEGSLLVSFTTGSAGTDTMVGTEIHIKQGGVPTDGEVTAGTYLWGVVNWPGDTTAQTLALITDAAGTIFSNLTYGVKIRHRGVGTYSANVSCGTATSTGYSALTRPVTVKDIEKIFTQTVFEITALPAVSISSGSIEVSDVQAFSAKPTLADVEKVQGQITLSIADVAKIFGLTTLTIADLAKFLGSSTLPSLTVSGLKNIIEQGLKTRVVSVKDVETLKTLDTNSRR